MTYRYVTFDEPNAFNATYLRDINDEDQLGGYYFGNVGVGLNRYIGFIYTAGNYTTFPLGGSDGSNGALLTGINDVGDAVLYTDVRFPFQEAYLYSNNTVTQIHVPGENQQSGPTRAYGINDSGQIVGSYNSPTPGTTGNHGFLYSGGVYTDIYDPLATPGNNAGTVAAGINNLGQIVGYFFDNSGVHGFIDNAGVFATLDDPIATGGTYAYGINDGGQIVGYYVDAVGHHGFLYGGGVYTTIDEPNAVGGTEVYGNNNLGQFVGNFVDGAGVHHGFIATLTTAPATATDNFNGDNYSDILWQNDNGTAGVWLMSSDGVTPMVEQGVGLNPGPAWHIRAIGDTDGDGHADIVWQNDNGTAGVWIMSADGFTPKAEIGVGTNPGAAWHIKAAADFDGDGRADAERLRHCRRLADGQRWRDAEGAARHRHQSRPRLAHQGGGRFRRRGACRHSLAERQRHRGRVADECRRLHAQG